MLVVVLEPPCCTCLLHACSYLMMAIQARQCGRLKRAPNMLYSLAQSHSGHDFLQAAAVACVVISHMLSHIESPSATGAQEILTEKQQEMRRMREEREAVAAATQKLLKSMCKTGFNCCIVAAPSNHPSSVMAKLMPLLAPSASFAIFSNWQQPLAECHLALQQSKQAVNLTLAESWWREYQVLPARTHPTMSTSGTGGYILSGTQIPCQL